MKLPTLQQLQEQLRQEAGLLTGLSDNQIAQALGYEDLADYIFQTLKEYYGITQPQWVVEWTRLLTGSVDTNTEYGVVIPEPTTKESEVL